MTNDDLTQVALKICFVDTTIQCILLATLLHIDTMQYETTLHARNMIILVLAKYILWFCNTLIKIHMAHECYIIFTSITAHLK